MHRLFIADLHLSPEHPCLTEGFLRLVNAHQSQINQLYILGDWFESWVGDDDDAEWLNPLCAALRDFTQHGGEVLVMHGNRDFLLGQQFLDRFGGQLLPEHLLLDTGSQTIRLEHGDALCVDDLKYQQFRQTSRSEAWKSGILSLPIAQRRGIAQFLRMQSQANYANTASNIMDVNDFAVEHAIGRADVLLHGHTHRPQVHALKNRPTPKAQQRMVLGDWRETDRSAIIARQRDGQPIALETWRF